MITAVARSTSAILAFNIWDTFCVDDVRQCRAIADSIIAPYCETDRYYHNLDHIKAMWANLDDEVSQSDLEHYRWLWIAIALHDVVYDPARSDNESRSVQFFRRVVAEPLQLNSQQVEYFTRVIMATTHDQNEMAGDQLYIADLDLMCLGVAQAEFDANTAKIRQEYAMYTDEEWRIGRAAFMNSILERSQIYHTKHFLERYEAKARANLVHGLELLDDTCGAS